MLNIINTDLEKAKHIAENILLYQRNSGGWKKNVNYDVILDSNEIDNINLEKNDTSNVRYFASCFDNNATTSELYFLANLYNKINDTRYKDSFNKGIGVLLESQYELGGWPQYYPICKDKELIYRSYITFNDNLIINILTLFNDIINDNDNIFKNILNEEYLEKIITSYNKGLECIINAQIKNDNDELTVWCGQHYVDTLLPSVGRNYEMPSYQISESSQILLFLMKIENPSDAIKNAVNAGCKFLYDYMIKDKKYVKVFDNEGKEIDRIIIDSIGDHYWPRFIQIGGYQGEIIYNKFFEYLLSIRKLRNAIRTYDKNMGDKPLYCIKDKGIYEYAFGYIYEDTPDIIDKNGKNIRISLNSYDRISYGFVGNWGDEVLKQYEIWKVNNYG